MDEPPLGSIEPLPPDIEVLPGTDLDQAWDRFRFFEAGHHRMSIMNPLSSDGLDRVVSAVAVDAGQAILDIACGHGEFLRRLAGSAMTGVDLSPWTLRRAHRVLAEAGIPATLVVGDGARYLDRDRERRWDLIALIGAPWIFGGFEPSARALAPRLNPGGRLVIADVVAANPEARARLHPQYGRPGTVEENRAILTDVGLEVLIEFPTTAEDWRAYDDRVVDGTEHWLLAHPGDTAYRDRQREYEAGRAEPDDVGWQVWIGRAG